MNLRLSNRGRRGWRAWWPLLAALTLACAPGRSVQTPVTSAAPAESARAAAPTSTPASPGSDPAPTAQTGDGPGYAPRALSAEQARADIELMWRALDRIHPGLDRYASADELAAARAHLARLAASETDDVALYREISLALAAIRCDHTKAEVPDRLSEYRQGQPSHLPFRFVVLDGRMYVVSSDPSAPGLSRGNEVVRIADRPVAELLTTLGRAIPVDGFTDSVKAVALASSGEFLGSGVDHFLPIFYGFARSFAVTTRASDGSERRTVVPAITFERWKTLPYDRGYRSDFADAVTFKQLDANTAYLAVSTFVNYRKPVDPIAVYQPIFAQLKREGIGHLIVDLRDNGGGSNDASTGLARFLLSRTFTWLRSAQVKSIGVGELKAHMSSWAREALDPPAQWFRARPDGMFEVVHPGIANRTQHTPHPDRFTGRITVLIGPNNASGVTMLLAKLTDAGRIRTVGMATGGSAEGPTAGILVFLTLPHSGIKVRIPVMRQYTDIARFTPGQGIEPDIVVPISAQDYFAGIDRALSVARAAQP
ncbi:MAG: S41 family peptidase [Myxococcota bacterium]